MMTIMMIIEFDDDYCYN